jgi:hypothetical protein
MWIERKEERTEVTIPKEEKAKNKHEREMTYGKSGPYNDTHLWS